VGVLTKEKQVCGPFLRRGGIRGAVLLHETLERTEVPALGRRRGWCLCRLRSRRRRFRLWGPGELLLPGGELARASRQRTLAPGDLVDPCLQTPLGLRIEAPRRSK